jgi:hypothetical protein
MDVESRTTEAIEKLRGGSASDGKPTVAPPMESTPAMAPAADRSVPNTSQKMATTATAPVAKPKLLSVAYCPMKKANWLQLGDDIANPYYGKEMSDCGEVTKHVAAPAEGTALKKFIDPYLAVQRDLNADKLDSANTQAMTKASSELNGEKYAVLRAAVGNLAEANDVAAARIAFKNVSDALIPLLPEAGK